MKIKGLINCEYIIENNKPDIYLFTRQNREKKIYKVKGFIPYFYKLKDAKVDFDLFRTNRLKQYQSLGWSNNYIGERLEKDILKVKQVYDNCFIQQHYIRTIDNEEVDKVFVNIPSDVALLRMCYSKTFEADILFPIRFLIDNIEKLEDDEFKICFLDIETTTTSGFPDKNNPQEAVTIISITDSFNEKVNTFAWHPKEKIQKEYAFCYNDEISMLKALIDFLVKENYDIIAGYNINFDLSYLASRCNKIYNIDILKQLSPLNEGYVRRKGETYIKGLPLFDVFIAYKKMHFHELSSYSLENVAREEGLGEKKRVLNFTKEWQDNFEQLVEYNRNDVWLVKQLNNKMQLITLYKELQLISVLDNITSCMMPSRIVDTIMLRKYHNKVIFPNKLRSDVKQKIGGGYVHEPEIGFHENVMVCDVAGCYPNLIRAFNISPETVSLQQTDNSIKIDIYKYNKDDEGKAHREFFKTVYIDQSKQGIIPSIVQEYSELKAKYKALVKKDNKNRGKYFAVKTFVNSMYGTMVRTLRISNPYAAETITFLGREVTGQWNLNIIKQMGYQVLATDTDSCFIKLNEKLNDKNMKNVVKQINNSYKDFVKQFGLTKHYLEIEVDKPYETFILGAKKHYAGKYLNSNIIEVIGLASIRSDTTKVAKKVERTAIEMLLNKYPMIEIINYIKDVIQGIYEFKFSYEDIATPTKLEEKPENYVYKKGLKKGQPLNLPKLRGIKWSKTFLNIDFKAGDKFYMLWCKQPNDTICFDYQERLKDVNIVLDMMKTLELNVFMKLETVFEAIKQMDVLNKLREDVKNMLIGQKTLLGW